MEFRVSRTSLFSSDSEPPVKGAVLRDYEFLPSWFIVLPEARILDFVREHGRCVVSWEKDAPHIEIYDDYRE